MSSRNCSAPIEVFLVILFQTINQKMLEVPTKNFLVNGIWRDSGKTFEVINPATLEPAFEVYRPAEEHLQEVIEGLPAGQKAAGSLTTQQRYEILRAAERLIADRQEELTTSIITEAGKPRRFAESEAFRATQTFGFAADALRSLPGEALNLDVKAGLRNKLGIVKRFPAGPVLGISPFNFPLNLVAHKVAPAIMAGNALVLKPTSATPVTALRLGEILLDAGWPPEALSVLPLSGRQTQPLVEHPAFRVVSFTGSDTVGWGIKASAGKKKVILELGGDAAAVVDETADVQHAAGQAALGAYAFAGQVCISVQRIIVVEAVYDAFKAEFEQALKKIRVGDPQENGTIVGPMIDPGEADRIQNWVNQAQQAGASVHGLQRREGTAFVEPGFLENLPDKDLKLNTEEAFAPIAVLVRAPDFNTALKIVNQSRYGLQAGIFTERHQRLKQAFHQLEVGGVVANDSPMFRVDNMPYGGVKDSGFGREGVRYAWEEMTEPRLLVW